MARFQAERRFDRRLLRRRGISVVAGLPTEPPIPTAGLLFIHAARRRPAVERVRGRETRAQQRPAHSSDPRTARKTGIHSYTRRRFQSSPSIAAGDTTVYLS